MTFQAHFFVTVVSVCCDKEYTFSNRMRFHLPNAIHISRWTKQKRLMYVLCVCAHTHIDIHVSQAKSLCSSFWIQFTMSNGIMFANDKLFLRAYLSSLLKNAYTLLYRRSTKTNKKNIRIRTQSYFPFFTLSWCSCSFVRISIQMYVGCRLLHLISLTMLTKTVACGLLVATHRTSASDQHKNRKLINFESGTSIRSLSASFYV